MCASACQSVSHHLIATSRHKLYLLLLYLILISLSLELLLRCNQKECPHKLILLWIGKSFFKNQNNSVSFFSSRLPDYLHSALPSFFFKNVLIFNLFPHLIQIQYMQTRSNPIVTLRVVIFSLSPYANVNLTVLL